MRTIASIIAVAVLAAPLVVLALRGTRLDPVRATRRGAAPGFDVASVDADRAQRDLVAARTAREPYPTEPAPLTPARAGRPRSARPTGGTRAAAA